MDFRADQLGFHVQVLLLLADVGHFEVPPLEAQLEFFEKTVHEHRGLRIAPVEKFKMSLFGLVGLKSGQFLEPSIGLQTDELVEAIARHSKIDAVVSFVGLPPISSQQFSRIKSPNQKWIVVSSRIPGLKNLLEGRLIDVVIVPRAEPISEGSKKSKLLKEWFDRTYVMFTPETAAVLP